MCFQKHVWTTDGGGCFGDSAAQGCHSRMRVVLGGTRVMGGDARGGRGERRETPSFCSPLILKSIALIKNKNSCLFENKT